ncbi:MAG: N-methyl-L-tryptophan oxidase [Acidobacteriota bacterium]
MKTEVDVVIVGGGIMGAATAATLARRGERVALLERRQIGHDRGSSHGDGRIVRLTYAEPDYVAMALRGYDGWRKLERASGEELLVTCGGLDIGPEGHEVVRSIHEMMREAGVACELLTASAMTERFPQLRASESADALFQPATAVIRAEAAWRTYVDRAIVDGAEVEEGVEITSMQTGLGVTVEAADGRSWRAERLVLTAGAWTNKFLTMLDEPTLPLETTHEQVAYLSPREAPVSHGPDRLPTVIDYFDTPLFYSLPRMSAEGSHAGVKIGWHRSGAPVDPDLSPRPPRPEFLQAIAGFTRRRFHHLDDPPTTVVDCLYTNTPDHHFVLDRLPGSTPIVIGAGFSGHGFKFAPAVAEVLAALSRDEPTPVPLDSFRLARFAGATVAPHVGA